MVYCHQHPISPPRVFVFHKKPLCLWKNRSDSFHFSLSLRGLHSCFCPQTALVHAKFTGISSYFMPVHPQFIFILQIESIGGPLLPPPNWRNCYARNPTAARPQKDDRHCICRDPCGVAAAQFLGLPRHDERPGQTGRLRHLPEHARRRRTEHR